MYHSLRALLWKKIASMKFSIDRVDSVHDYFIFIFFKYKYRRYFSLYKTEGGGNSEVCVERS